MTDILRDLLSAEYGTVKMNALSGGYNNAVYRMDCDKGAFVVKASADNMKGLKTEKQALTMLSGSNIAPEIVSWHVNGNIACEVMTVCMGENAQSVLDSGDFHESINACVLLGKVLKNVHTREGLPKIGVNDVLPLPDFIPDKFVLAIEKRLECLSGDLCLTHGDFGLHNAIYDKVNGKIKLIDWEWAADAPRGRDVGWFRWFLNLHYSDIADELYEAFMSGYGEYNETQSESAAIMYQVASILKIAAKAPDDETRTEWLRRLKFTLDKF